MQLTICWMLCLRMKKKTEVSKSLPEFQLVSVTSVCAFISVTGHLGTICTGTAVAFGLLVH